jgi:hypothetical protein
MQLRHLAFAAFSLSLGCADDSPSNIEPVDRDAAVAPASDACSSTPTPRAAPEVWSPIVDAKVPIVWGGDSFCATTVVRCPPTKGPLPPDAVDENLRTVWDKVPDYVAALDGDHIAGYVDRYDLFCGGDEPQAVWDDSLQHIVGHMVPGRGFVRGN